MKLEGKVVLVTGAGRGIGKALALGFAHEGADVVVVSRSRDKLEVTAEEINKLGRKALALEADVSQEHDVRRIADEISRLGQRNRYESAWPILRAALLMTTSSLPSQLRFEKTPGTQ